MAIAFMLVFGYIIFILSIVAAIIGLFFGNIILFDSLLLALVSGYLAHDKLALHPVFCILIGFSVLVILYSLQRTRIGFWSIGIFLSYAWSSFIGQLVLEQTGHDMIWYYFSLIISFIIMIGLHVKARNRSSANFALED